MKIMTNLHKGCLINPMLISMNRGPFFLVLFFALTFSSCQSDPAPSEGADAPGSLGEIMRMAEDINLTADTMQRRGPVTVEHDGVNHEVVAYFRADEPVLLYVNDNAREQWLYLADRRLAMLKQVSFDGSRFEERQYFYTPDAFLRGRVRTAKSETELDQANFRKLPADADDFRFDAEQANTYMVGLMYGQ